MCDSEGVCSWEGVVCDSEGVCSWEGAIGKVCRGVRSRSPYMMNARVTLPNRCRDSSIAWQSNKNPRWTWEVFEAGGGEGSCWGDPPACGPARTS